MHHHTDVKGTFQPAAAASVAALIGDLAHLVRKVPRQRWAATAALIIEHHSPTIESTKLSDTHAELQKEAHALLRTVSAAATSLTGATMRSIVEKAESIISRWNDENQDAPRLLVTSRPTAEPVIDLRVSKGRQAPEFIEPTDPTNRWFEFRKLAERLR